jgi:hypothetical protein
MKRTGDWMKVARFADVDTMSLEACSVAVPRSLKDNYLGMLSALNIESRFFTYTSNSNPCLQSILLEASELLIVCKIRVIHWHKFERGRVEDDKRLEQMCSSISVDLLW